MVSERKVLPMPAVEPLMKFIIIIISSGSLISVHPRCSHLEHRASVKRFVSLQFLNLRQSVGLLGRGISPSQGRYVHKHRMNANIHALSGIRIHDSSVRPGEDMSCLATAIGGSLS
jgi:hypothetical protein